MRKVWVAKRLYLLQDGMRYWFQFKPANAFSFRLIFYVKMRISFYYHGENMHSFPFKRKIVYAFSAATKQLW